MQHRFERISIQTPRHRIVGVATLASDGYRSRLSDLLNAPERDFIPLTDATVTELFRDRPYPPIEAGWQTARLGPFGYRWLRLGGIY